MIFLLNGHAGAGLGQILIAVAIAAFAVTCFLFYRVYTRGPSRWLRMLGLFYAGIVLAHLAVAATLSPAALLSLGCFLLVATILAAIVWLKSVFSARAA